MNFEERSQAQASMGKLNEICPDIIEGRPCRRNKTCKRWHDFTYAGKCWFYKAKKGNCTIPNCLFMHVEDIKTVQPHDKIAAADAVGKHERLDGLPNNLDATCMAGLYSRQAMPAEEQEEDMEGMHNRIHTLEFDSTLGYPGEGPLDTLNILTWNIGGSQILSTHGRLKEAIGLFEHSKYDALLLQEHQLDEDGIAKASRLLEACQTPLVWRFNPRPAGARARGGTAIVAKQSKCSDASFAIIARRDLPGACTVMTIGDIKLFSIYAPQDP
ncbi:MAG: hypothetical protein GY764_05040, partial [Halieaceae bacterium]|nr:hypothetical protein [Halieaceae bacterium]